MTSEELDRLEALLASATGPWETREWADKSRVTVFQPCVRDVGFFAHKDAALIAAARNALPFLIKAAREREELVKKLRFVAMILSRQWTSDELFAIRDSVGALLARIDGKGET